MTYTTDMNIAILLPSRGLIFSETIDEIIAALDYVAKRELIDFHFYFSHRVRIPECFEEPMQRILAAPAVDYIWIVEEDMVLPRGILLDMIDARADVVTADYPVAPGVGAVTYSDDGTPLYGGTGCLLIKRSVMDRLVPPYFETDNEYDTSGNLIGKKSEASKQVMYGQHDVSLWLKFRELGITPVVTERRAGQRRLVDRGPAGVNNGSHTITEMTL